MIATILGWFMKSKGAKIGAGALSGGGLVAIILSLHANVMTKIDQQKKDQKEYVNLSIKPIETEISYIKKEQIETKSMVRDIHNYLIKAKNK